MGHPKGAWGVLALRVVGVEQGLRAGRVLRAGFAQPTPRASAVHLRTEWCGRQ
jgi:hypothetical protein